MMQYKDHRSICPKSYPRICVEGKAVPISADQGQDFVVAAYPAKYAQILTGKISNNSNLIRNGITQFTNWKDLNLIYKEEGKVHDRVSDDAKDLALGLQKTLTRCLYFSIPQ